jgi:hypothetical protein
MKKKDDRNDGAFGLLRAGTGNAATGAYMAPFWAREGFESAKAGKDKRKASGVVE